MFAAIPAVTVSVPGEQIGHLVMVVARPDLTELPQRFHGFVAKFFSYPDDQSIGNGQGDYGGLENTEGSSLGAQHQLSVANHQRYTGIRDKEIGDLLPVHILEQINDVVGGLVECIDHYEIIFREKNELFENIFARIRNQHALLAKSIQPKAQIRGQRLIRSAAENVGRIRAA